MVRKPRIFINMHYMELGGAERALIGLLNALDTNLVDVDLFINQHTGEFMPLIPEKINLLPEKKGYNAIERPMKQIIKEGHVLIALARLHSKRAFKKYKRKKGISSDASASHYVMDSVIRFLPSLYYLGEYDLAISFLDPPHIVQDKVLAKKRIEWIHTDFGIMNLDYDRLMPRWAANDYIASISPDITVSFLKAFPLLKDKIIEIENILSPKFIREQSCLMDVSSEMPSSGLKFLSIGRYSYQKNFDNIPEMARLIIDMGYDDFHWYIIGYGGSERIIREKIQEYGVEDHVILLGKKKNPYPYIKSCDIYVQPSRYEGKSITVREAQILFKPVIITRYPTSGSQVMDGIDGVICGMDNESVARAVVDLAQDREKQKKIIDYLHCHDYGNEAEVEKIYKLVGVN